MLLNPVVLSLAGNNPDTFLGLFSPQSDTLAVDSASPFSMSLSEKDILLNKPIFMLV